MGLAVAKRAVLAGATPILIARNEKTLAAASDEVGGAKTFAADFTNSAAIENIFRRIDRIDHVVICAGTSEVVPICEGSVDYWQSVFHMRLVSPLHVIQQAVPKMKGGSITLMSGTLAVRPSVSGYAVLTAAVSGIEGLARALALELAPIRVNAISPGLIDTPLLRSALEGASEAYLRENEARLPAKRMGTADEAAEAILLLMTNGYMTAEVLHVDGGMRLV